MSEPFDDPKLKEAMGRALRSHAAPEHLRGRVGRIIHPRFAKQRGRVVALGIGGGACLLAILLTIVGNSPVSAAKGTIPNSLASALVTTHDNCSRDVDHHLIPGIAVNDFRRVGTILAGRVGVPVLSTPLADWNFAGAGPCPVGGHASAHLLYRNGQERLSVFSLKADDFHVNSDSGDFDMDLGRHHLAGFTRDGAVYCVVADSLDGSATTDSAQKLRDQLRDDFAPVLAAAPVHGEMLQTVHPVAMFRPANIQNVQFSPRFQIALPLAYHLAP